MFSIFCDFSKRWQTGFQDPATPVMEGIIDLHHSIFFFLIIILIIVLFVFKEFFEIFLAPISNIMPTAQFYLKIMLTKADGLDVRAYSFKRHLITSVFLRKLFTRYKNFTHNAIIEIVWTVIPSIVLILIAIPSFMLLYAIDEIVYPQITVKILGHQWFWSYESYDIFNSEAKTIYKYDSYMIPSDELNVGQLRLLEVDLPLYLPIRTHIRLLITSSDVLHSWAVPALGVKMDAVPGRLNQVSIFIKRVGVFYGQCSEICGINHGFMPIVVKAIPVDNYLNNLIKIN